MTTDDALAPGRDAGGRFGKGNPGRRRGSRNRMTNHLANALLDDFGVHEAETIERLRRWYFPQYVQLMGRFLPREARETRPDFGDYSAEERAKVAAAARATLDEIERGKAGLDALLAVLEGDPAEIDAACENGSGPVAEDISNTVNYGESTVG
jgi:hypothetical protein